MSYPPPPLSQQPHMSLPSSATSTDLLNKLLQHIGVPSAHLESANLKIGYKLLCPYGEGVIADFVAPLQEFPIEDFLCRVPTDDLGSRLLHVSMFSEDPTILIKPSRPCSGLLPHRVSTRNGPTSPLQTNSPVFLFMRTQTIVLRWSFQKLRRGAS